MVNRTMTGDGNGYGDTEGLAEARRRIAYALATRASGLDLSELGLTRVPPEISSLVRLTDLSLSFNQLTRLPPEIMKLSSLTKLDLGFNLFETLTAEIGELTALTELYLHGNKLTALPPEIGELSSLLRLYVQRNRLTALPPEIGRLRSLSWLHLGENQLRSLPVEIRQIPRLKVLRLQNNPGLGLSDELLGAAMDNKPAREVIAAYFALRPPPSSGTASAVPHRTLPRKDSIRVIMPKGQSPAPQPQTPPAAKSEVQRARQPAAPQQQVPQQHVPPARPAEPAPVSAPAPAPAPVKQAPPPEAAKSAVPHSSVPELPAVPAEPVPILQARIILLGDGAVGKTSLLRQFLSGQGARLSEGKTAGIAIKSWPVSAQGKTIDAQVWDFGGQGEMHAAHPYFFGRRTLYLIVVEGRQDHLIRERLGYWLEMVQSYAGKDAQIIIVQNKSDQHVAHLDEDEWRERHPGLAEHGAFHSVSCLNGQGIAGLETAITRHLEAMPSVWEKWPVAWMQVKAAVIRTLSPRRPTLSMEEYTRICEAAQVREEVVQTTLLKALHDLGLAVAYPDDPRLVTLGVLDPAWVRAGIYALLNHPQLVARQGVLLESELPSLLASVPGYKPHHGIGLLKLMAKFELAFSTGEGWIIPGLLTPTAVPAAKSEPFTRQDKPLRFEFHYEMLPETLITRFIARKHTIAARNGGASWWRHGMILECEGCPALVQAEVGRSGKVAISVSGPANRRRDALTAMRHAIHELHTEPQRESVQCKVPLPDHPDVAVDYDELLLLEEKGEKTNRLKHRGKFLSYLVSDLLDGVGRPSRGEVHIHQIHGDGATVNYGDIQGGIVGGMANAAIDRREPRAGDSPN